MNHCANQKIDSPSGALSSSPGMRDGSEEPAWSVTPGDRYGNDCIVLSMTGFASNSIAAIPPEINKKKPTLTATPTASLSKKPSGALTSKPPTMSFSFAVSSSSCCCALQICCECRLSLVCFELQGAGCCVCTLLLEYRKTSFVDVVCRQLYRV